MDQPQRIKNMKITDMANGYTLVDYPNLGQEDSREAFYSKVDFQWRWRSSGHPIDDLDIMGNIDAEVARRKFEEEFDSTPV